MTIPSYARDKSRRWATNLDLNASELVNIDSADFKAQSEEQTEPSANLSKLQGALRSVRSLSNKDTPSRQQLLSVIRDLDSTGSKVEPDLKPLEWLVYSRLTVEVYGLVMSTMLNDAVLLRDEMYYWESVERDASRAGWHLVQSWSYSHRQPLFC